MRSSLVTKFRRTLLPPESRQELFLRTLYHRLNASPFFINRQVRKAAVSYREWRERKFEQSPLPMAEPGTTPGVTFLIEITAGGEAAALETIRSLQGMTVTNWRVIPVLGRGVKWDEAVTQLGGENRVKEPLIFEDFSVNLLKKSPDDFVVFSKAGDLFHPSLLHEFFAGLESSPSADVIYTDSEYRSSISGETAPFFKPSALSPELMLSVNYLSRAFLRASALADDHMGFPDLMSLEYDLDLRLMKQDTIFHHIPRVLVSTSDLYPVREGARVDLLTSFFEQQGLDEVVVQSSGAQTRVTWDFGAPSVSLIVLSQNHGMWLRNLVDSIFTLTDYPNYSMIIVDNRSDEPDVLAFYDELKENPRVEVVHYDQSFNYSEAINLGVSRSTAEVVVLLNNDMLVTDKGWLRELVQWAVHPGIGVVGAKLLHRNRTIQHAGIVLGMNGFIGHLYLNAPEHYHGLAGSVDWYRNFYAITGACQAIRRDLFHLVGGYDERFRLAFGDIDFCLRVVEAGYRNLYNPFARLIHFEGGSRGYETPVKDILFGYDELLPWLEKDDPYFSPNLTYEPIPLCNLNASGVDVRLANIQLRKQVLLNR